MRALAALIVGLLLQTSANAADLTVFAAASLTEVMTTLGKRFEAESGLRTSISLAGSSVLARQIERGAPADVFISANATWMNHLLAAGAVARQSRRTIASNSLVLVAGPSARAMSLRDIVNEPDTRLIMGDPAHVPVGIYARQSLEKLGFWRSLSERIVPASSTRSALVFVQRGAVAYGIVYNTDAIAYPDLRIIDRLPDSSHDPIRYQAAVTARGQKKNSGNTAMFMRFLGAVPSIEIMQDAGFVTCDQATC